MIRRFFFWTHLAAGLVAGLVILSSAVTGAILSFEPQIVEFMEKDVRRVEPPMDVPRQNLQALIQSAKNSRSKGRVSSVTVSSDPEASVSVGFGRDGSTYVNPYTGTVLGGVSKTHDVMHAIEDWHRWLVSRDSGKPITGAATLAFFFLVVSGLINWWPKKWTRPTVKAAIAFNPRLNGKRRDWNWHTVIGFWSLPVLAVITLTGVVMSYTWANNLLYRMTGNEPPPVVRRADPAPGAKKEPPPPEPANLDALYQTASTQLPGWTSITLRFPQKAGGPVSATITEENGWPPHPRSQLSMNAETAAVEKWEPYNEANLGRKARFWVRYLHTGEAAGPVGQLIALLACVGGVILVWTGFALSWRRFFGKKGPASPVTAVSGSAGPITKRSHIMSGGKLGLFYGSTTGFTQVIADQIKGIMGDEIHLFKSIADTKPEDMLSCDRLILGIPTWDDGQLQADWWSFFPKLDTMNFSGKTIAIFGLGDQNGYPDTFLDAIGTLGNKTVERGGTLVGFWPVDGYSFAKSTAIKDGKFMGLGIDTVSQDDKTEERVQSWVKQIRAEFQSGVPVA